jgi:prepilin-type N-terminal cleavage/methylation domain-containing protein
MSLSCKPAAPPVRSSSGMTLVELLVTTTILGIVLMTVSAIMLSSSRVQSRTVRRAEIQSAGRQALSLMATELRQAGADPSQLPAGVIGIVAAQANMVHLRADLNGDGVIQTAEPSEDVTYRYDSTAHVVTRDAGPGPAAILMHVTRMQLSYYDGANQALATLPLSATDAARVKTVGLTITSENRDSQPIALTTRITLRNR